MRRTTVGIVALAGTLSACVLGYRGLAAFSGEHDLTGIDEVRIELPDTPLSIDACAAEADDCPAVLAYDGEWASVGGSGNEAERAATGARLRFSSDGAFAALQAVVPLELLGQVDLQMGEIRLPDDRDLDLRTGTGDVEVFGVEASVAIDVEVGDVTVYGADGGLGVHTGRGTVVVETSGAADLESGRGSIEVTQTGSGRDLRVEVGAGDILVRLAADGDLDLEIRAPQTIRVRTDAITTVTEGHFERRTGTGGVRVELVTGAGSVEVQLAD